MALGRARQLLYGKGVPAGKGRHRTPDASGGRNTHGFRFFQRHFYLRAWPTFPTVKIVQYYGLTNYCIAYYCMQTRIEGPGGWES